MKNRDVYKNSCIHLCFMCLFHTDAAAPCGRTMSERGQHSDELSANYD